MNIFSKKILVCAVAAIAVGVNSGCNSQSNDVSDTTAIANPVQDNITPGADVAQTGDNGKLSDSNAVNGVESQDIEDSVLSNFDTLKANFEKGVVESKPVSTNLAKGWKEIQTTGVRVIDGDTVEVLIDGQQSERVRLIGIDAPESKQEFGKESKATLEECIGGKPVTILYKEKDRYSRILGKVMAGNTDCNFYQVGIGSAWHYKQYQDEQPNDDKYAYSDAEKVAKMHSNGLWFTPEPEAPWLYRKKH